MLADPTPSPLARHWRQRDLQVLWHPCTQMREHPHTLPLVPIARGEGAWLIDHDGNRYLDAVSSWWTNLFGHAEPRIGGAIAAQATQLEQVMLAGFGHEPAITLAERLLALAPRQPGREPLAKVFYADNGSAGVEVALKMAFQYFQNRGEPRRTRFIALENGYHGETLGALALGDIPLYRRVYAPLLAEGLFAPSPDAYLAEPGQSAADRARQAADGLATLFDQHPEMGFVAASCRYIDADDHVIGPGAPQPPKHHRAGDEALTVLLTTGFPHVSSIVMRRACYEALGKFDERIWHGPDVEMDARLASKYDFYHFGAVHTSSRRHGANMGSLEYLRRDFLEVDMLKRRLAWGYLTEAGRQQLGVNDLESFIASTEGQVALSGVINSVAYGRGDLGRFYLREALRYDPACWRRPIFWKALALAAAPGLGQRIMQRRMSIHAEDMHAAAIVKDSLDQIA